MTFKTRLGRSEALWLAAGLMLFALGNWLKFTLEGRWATFVYLIPGVFGLLIVFRVIRKTYFGATGSE